jgi:hypothetical protein
MKRSYDFRARLGTRLANNSGIQAADTNVHLGRDGGARSNMQLATGLEINDPWELLTEMRERYYPAFDGVPVAQGSQLHVPEIAL